MRLRKKYPNGKPRGGVSGVTVDTSRTCGKKNYHKQELSFHGSEQNFEKWRDAGRLGYNRAE